MTPKEHALLHVRDYGGRPEDYVEIDEFLGSSKPYGGNHPDHRAILHNTFGVDLCVRLFGETITNSNGVAVNVRDVAIDHIQQDCDGRVPSVKLWLDLLRSGESLSLNKPLISDKRYLRRLKFGGKSEQSV